MTFDDFCMYYVGSWFESKKGELVHVTGTEEDESIARMSIYRDAHSDPWYRSCEYEEVLDILVPGGFTLHPFSYYDGLVYSPTYTSARHYKEGVNSSRVLIDPVGHDRRIDFYDAVKLAYFGGFEKSIDDAVESLSKGGDTQAIIGNGFVISKESPDQDNNTSNKSFVVHRRYSDSELLFTYYVGHKSSNIILDKDTEFVSIPTPTQQPGNLLASADELRRSINTHGILGEGVKVPPGTLPKEFVEHIKPLEDEDKTLFLYRDGIRIVDVNKPFPDLLKGLPKLTALATEVREAHEKNRL